MSCPAPSWPADMLRGHVRAVLWDVYWTGDGFGKHGRGPFATQRQAAACLRAVGWSGDVCQVEYWTTPDNLARILRKAAP